MDSYIVRVYRREHGASGDEVAGLVEEVGTDQRKSFQTFSGLVTTIRQVVGRDTSQHSNVCDLNPDMAAETINE
jgi:ribosomal protein L19